MISKETMAIVATFVLAALPAPSLAAPGNEATASGNASAEVIAPLTFEAVAPLEFGTLAVSPSDSGSISVDPAGGPPIYAGSLRAACSTAALCDASPARFAVRGQPGRYYRIEYPDQTYASPVSSSAPALLVKQIAVATDNLSSRGARGQLSAEGADGFRVGGTLEVPGGTAAGRYRATLNIVVSYD